VGSGASGFIHSSWNIWYAFDNGAYASGLPSLDAEEKQRLQLLSLRSELWQYYKDRRDSDQDWKKTGTQIWNITLGMLGKKDGPNLKSKAAEASGMLLFVVVMLERHLPTVTDPVKILKGKLLLAAGQAALSFDNILKENKACRNIPYKISEQLFKSYMRFLTFYERAGGNLTPKCHLMFHIVQKKRCRKEIQDSTQHTTMKVLTGLLRASHVQCTELIGARQC